MNATAPIPTGTSLYKQEKIKHWWYELLDFLVANPGKNLRDAMTHVGRSYPTVLSVYNSDLFQELLVQRRTQMSRSLDLAIHERSVKIAAAGLDIISEKLEKKRDSIPLSEVAAVTESALTRLGYGTQKNAAPSVSVNINNGQQVVAPVSADALRDARAALQGIERQNAQRGLPAPSPLRVIDQEATPGVEEVEQEIIDVDASPA